MRRRSRISRRASSGDAESSGAEGPGFRCEVMSEPFEAHQGELKLRLLNNSEEPHTQRRPVGTRPAPKAERLR